MDQLNEQLDASFTPLPINLEQGFPQSFPFLFDGRTYHFTLYANVAAHLLDARPEFLSVPTDEAFLVCRVEHELADTTRETIFLRKVVPRLQYEAENIKLLFSEHRIARDNLNGQGEHGTQLVGGIGRRWE